VLCITVVCLTVATRPGLLRAAVAVDGAGGFVDLAAALARALSVLGAVCCAGALVTARVLLPRDRSSDSAANLERLDRAASRWAWLWAVAAAAEVVLLAASVTGQSLEDVLTVGPGAAAGFVALQVRAWAVAAWTAGLVALVATRARSAVVRASLLVATAGGMLAPLLTGHGGGAGVPWAATLALGLHVLAASCWVGGLVAVCLHVRGRRLAATVASFSRLALVCSLLVGLSGLANVAVRLSWQELLHSGAYGGLLAAKVTGIVVLGFVGRRHRRRTLPALAKGDAGPLWRLAGLEMTLMVAVIGVAVVLSGTAPTPEGWGVTVTRSGG
jgi:putative copper resistance protein D